MNMLLSLVLVVQVIAAIGLIVLVLLQHGKGADMGAAFGSGASGSLFGATGSANFLSRLTAAMATVFFLCTLGLAFLANQRVVTPSSVMDQPAKAGSTPSTPAAPGAVPGPVPGAAPGAASGVSPGAVPATGAAPASVAPPASGDAKLDPAKPEAPKANQGSDIPK